MSASLRDRIRHHLGILVEEIGPRPPGSPAGARATAHVREVLSRSGLAVESFAFATRWWEPGAGRLEVDGRTYEVEPNPFSPPGASGGRLRRVATIDELRGLAPEGDVVLLLEGDLAREQVMPSAFPFFNPEEHRAIVAELGRLRPAAVIAATDHWAPVFEDPDLPFASITVPAAMGAKLVDGAGVRLEIGGAVHAGAGETVTGRAGTGRRTVVSAHLDSKVTTPGAFDNGASVAVLLAAVETGLLGRDVAATGPLELVFFNGEDHFDAAGEQAWLAATDLSEVRLNVNLDGAGVAGRRTSVVGLACPAAVEHSLADFVAARPAWVVADPWFESDHAVFAMAGIPAVAVTSERVHDLLSTVAHTAHDTIDVLDLDGLAGITADLPSLVADVVRAL